MLYHIMRRVLASVGAAGSVLGCLAAGTLTTAPSARAVESVYLLNVTVRPVYGFANADQALAYGYGLCDKIRQGRGYPQLVADMKADFHTNDEFSASYLVSQATQELCPEVIGQLRNSAGGYRPTG
jgi:hypothetical protein